MAGTVLLVEDESSLADNVLYVLRTEGFVAHWRALGAEAIAYLQDATGGGRTTVEPVDLVILDIGLPDASGFEVCKAIRAFSQVPIIFLTARADEIDRVVGLEIGGDDYVVKPFSPRELVARVKAILKRSRAPRVPTTDDALAVTTRGPFVVDPSRARISYVGIPLELTRYELLLLQFLVAHPEQVFSRAQLLERVWDVAQTSLDRTVDAHVKSLRAKLRTIAPDRDPIRTHRGLGYSRWNDVYLTLRGKYGARSTRADPQNEMSSVMHVAAPVTDAGRIIGVVTVAKPNITTQPFIETSRRKLARAGIVLMALSLAVGLAFSAWLSGSVGRIVKYADDLSRGRRVAMPRLRGELAVLGQAVTKLRAQLDGKTYVEEYVHALTHEMKSPVAAIRGAAELLDEEMPPAERTRFLTNIRVETERLQQVIDRALGLARLEQRQALETRARIDLTALADEVLATQAAAVKARGLTVERHLDAAAVVHGDPFLVRQALGNLLDNAIAFAPRGGNVRLTTIQEANRCRVIIHNSGAPIPPFAEGRLFERFYSLPRPDTAQKSTGLGLPFVSEVAALHQGEVRVGNHPEGGVTAELVLPIA